MGGKRIDEEIEVKKRGWKNFADFVFSFYYKDKNTFKKTAFYIGVSPHKLRSLFEKRGWYIRNRKEVAKFFIPRPSLLERKVLLNTKFFTVKIALDISYNDYFLTTYEMAKFFKISQTSVLYLMNKYKISRRNQGTRKLRR